MRRTRPGLEIVLLGPAVSTAVRADLQVLGVDLLDRGAPKFEIDNRFIFAKHLSILGSTMSTISEFRTVMDLVFAGKLKSILDKTFPLKEAAAAQERLWRGENFGKITLDIS